MSFILRRGKLKPHSATSRLFPHRDLIPGAHEHFFQDLSVTPPAFRPEELRSNWSTSALISGAGKVPAVPSAAAGSLRRVGRNEPGGCVNRVAEAAAALWANLNF